MSWKTDEVCKMNRPITPEDVAEAYKRGYLEGYKLGARLQTPINEWDVPENKTLRKGERDDKG